MSCHGCRVLRKRCDDSCVLRPCLDWIESPEAKGRATVFVSKFFGRTDLINFISSVPSHKRNALFQSLLFEAVGRTVNPVNGAIGLLSTGNWHLCQAAVRTVLAGGTPTVVVNGSHIDEVSESTGNQIPCSSMPPLPNLKAAAGDQQSFSVSKVLMSFRCCDAQKPKLLNLLV
ncbi:hypothetical protein L6452_06370 [Arctium lappa]|uniref:Uncharacterized protein n=1 Tax=Arctium lappa TaxID=4217 RepID=A0ACB9EIC9_ARCLA|nr:hypothetical protein L6452_06370 [Arctium lappa]